MPNTPTLDLSHKPSLRTMRRLLGSPDTGMESGIVLEARRNRPPRSRTNPAENLEGRSGFDRNFLGSFVVDLPTPDEDLADDIVPVGTDSSGRLDYMHFSVVMQKSRKLALFTAVNMDGKESVKITRENDKWFLDGRIPAEDQAGEDLYYANALDRGHLESVIV